ncbi:hypothetical protein Fmac_028308 [Flemingia macrophylla]|uniref:Uncharacterized protein n=1 Tax=Flemingia macrophylla TaxID=520843 RepID=A0ABD1L750_9FABA
MHALFENATITYVRGISFHNLWKTRVRQIKTGQSFDLEPNLFNNIGVDISPRRGRFFQSLMERFGNITELREEISNII